MQAGFHVVGVGIVVQKKYELFERNLRAFSSSIRSKVTPCETRVFICSSSVARCFIFTSQNKKRRPMNSTAVPRRLGEPRLLYVVCHTIAAISGLFNDNQPCAQVFPLVLRRVAGMRRDVPHPRHRRTDHRRRGLRSRRRGLRLLLACQTVRLVCYRETDALAPMVAAGFAVIVWLVVLTRRNRDS